MSALTRQKIVMRLRLSVWDEEVEERINGGQTVSALCEKNAKELNCNMANLYHYFHDIDELFLYAGIKCLKDYLVNVQKMLEDDSSK